MRTWTKPLNFFVVKEPLYLVRLSVCFSFFVNDNGI